MNSAFATKVFVEMVLLVKISTNAPRIISFVRMATALIIQDPIDANAILVI